MRAIRLGVLSVLVLASTTVVAGACGGSSSTDDVLVPTDDGGDGSSPANDASGGQDVGSADSATSDTGAADGGTSETGGDATSADDANDAGAFDASDDVSTGCSPNDSACATGGGPGLCKGGTCGACTDVTDDPTCATAYGTAHLCIGGNCIAADCRSSTDCAGNANGPLCGVSILNMCGKCTQDGQCAAGEICNTTTGACVSQSQCGGQVDNAACPANAADVCCGSVCVPGNCCTGAPANTSCQTQLGNNQAVCSNHICTTCNGVTGLVYLVDPVNGNDQTGTGSGTSGAQVATASCAFKTITRALQVLGASPAVGTTISIVGAAAGVTVNGGESFPIRVPAGVKITTQTGPVKVSVPAGKVGFILSTAASSVQGGAGAALTIDGQAHSALSGVVVGTGSTDGTKLADVTIKDFLGDGIYVQNQGKLRINHGVVSTNHGTTTARASGLHGTGQAQIVIAVEANETQTSFNGNTSHGIVIDNKANVKITAVAGVNGAGSVVANGNHFAGLLVQQTPGSGLPLNDVDGLVTWANTPGNGIRVQGGSSLRLRNVYALANAGNGVVVQTYANGTGRNNSLTNIDLGTAATGTNAGKNTLQAPAGSNPNVGAGICLQLDPASGTLSAQGNKFNNADCSAAAAQLTTGTGCGNQHDLGGIALGNDVNVASCTHP